MTDKSLGSAMLPRLLRYPGLTGAWRSFAFFGIWHFEGVKLDTIVCAR